MVAEENETPCHNKRETNDNFTATHNFKWLKITHICLIQVEIFSSLDTHFVLNSSD